MFFFSSGGVDGGELPPPPPPPAGHVTAFEEIRMIVKKQETELQYLRQNLAISVSRAGGIRMFRVVAVVVVNSLAL